jgi:periplasmic protein TonB
MKNALLIIALLISTISFGQEKATKSEPELVPPPPPTIYDVVDDPADFPGGMEAARKYLSENMIYPESAIKKKLEGKCYLKFIISDSGKVINVKVIRGVMDCPECDAEAIRVLRSMPNWEPGKINGKPVNSTFTLPVQFKL